MHDYTWNVFSDQRTHFDLTPRQDAFPKHKTELCCIIIYGWVTTDKHLPKAYNYVIKQNTIFQFSVRAFVQPYVISMESNLILVTALYNLTY